MTRRQTRSKRLATAARWPLGIGLTSWRYMWRTTPMHRSEVVGSIETDRPPAIPPSVDERELQLPEGGAGPLFHRLYVARIRGAALPPDRLMERLRRDINQVVPGELARFQKLRGQEAEMRVGDEYVVRMPGPWDGPIRVVAVTPTSFRFVTLAGHLEAGQIQFSASSGTQLEFTIESWARSSDRFVDLLYDRVRMAKEVQLHMWTSVLERAAKLSGGRLTGGVEIRTRKTDPEEPERRPLRDAHARHALDALHDVELNFDLSELQSHGSKDRWLVDDYCQRLPSESPGPPTPGGSWEIGRELMHAYEFADPAIVRAVYHPDRPIEERDMLLELRFLGLRFHVGVRVAGVIDDTRQVDGRDVRIWGWSYRTLQGHLETGQMDYEIWKWLDDGTVEFRIHVVSRAARVANPLVRIGFRLFGRRQQVRFARHACERMERLVLERLGGRVGLERLARLADNLVVQPASGV